MNIFELASREKFRFPSTRGELNVEQLWDLPLESRAGLDLDSVAKAVNKEVNASKEESFVKSRTVASTLLEAKLGVVKRIIEVKLEDREVAYKAAENRRLKSQLTDILAEKQNAALRELSEEELQEKISELG